MVVLSGLRITLVRSVFTCNARRMRMRRENAYQGKFERNFMTVLNPALLFDAEQWKPLCDIWAKLLP